jgi:thiamine-phosphate pyrophosphorylase
MSRPLLCYVTERRSLPARPDFTREAALVERIRDAAYAGVDWVQIREKDLDGKPLCDLVSASIAAIRGSSVKVMVNDRLDVAWATGASGVHLGENALTVAEVVKAQRRFGTSEFLVGASCHSLEAARRAAQHGADYVFFGPVFATPSKAAFGAPQGLERLAEVCRSISIPTLAIGGISAENAEACITAGAAGIAAIRLFQDSRDLSTLPSKLR